MRSIREKWIRVDGSREQDQGSPMFLHDGLSIHMEHRDVQQRKSLTAFEFDTPPRLLMGATLFARDRRQNDRLSDGTCERCMQLPRSVFKGGLHGGLTLSRVYEGEVRI